MITRRARLGGLFLDRDLTGQVLAAIPPAPARRRPRLAVRAALLALALGQLAITVPLLILGHDHDAGTHAAHELGSFDLALAIAFAVGAIRPTLSAGLAWPCSIAAGGLVGTAIADLIGGQTIGADEAQHLIAAAGAVLLLWQARTSGTAPRTPAPSARPTGRKRPALHRGGRRFPAGRPAAVSRRRRRPPYRTRHRAQRGGHVAAGTEQSGRHAAAAAGTRR